MDRKIRVGAVSYLNTKPLLYGLENSPLMNETTLVTDYPARIATMLLNDEIDVGLVPVAIIPEMKTFYLNTRYCIGCTGPVASVCLFSDVPMEEIETVMLDYQSRTSVALARLLLKEYWKKEVQFVSAEPGYEKTIKGPRAAVVIGDRALQIRAGSAYIYDLGEAWIKHTQFPFVFAGWISNKKLPEDWVSRFEQANGIGFEKLEEVIAENQIGYFDLHSYYKKHLNYDLDERKRQGLKLFISKLTGSALTVPI